MENKIKQLLLEQSEQLFGTKTEEKSVQFQLTRKEFEGDLTLVVFPFAKLLKSSPIDAANKIGEFLKQHISEIANYNVVQGFLNISLSSEYWKNKLQAIDTDNSFGREKADSKGTILVEYSSPNTNKPLHLGHLRNNFLG